MVTFFDFQTFGTGRTGGRALLERPRTPKRVDDDDGNETRLRCSTKNASKNSCGMLLRC